MNILDHRKKANAVFVGCCMLGIVYVGLVCNTAGLYFNDMAKDLKVNMSAVTLTMSFLNGGGLLGILFAGRALEKIDSRILMSLCAAAVGGGLLLGASSQSIYLFYLVWAVIGFSAPFLMSVAIPTLLGNWFPGKLGSVLGIVYGMAGIGGAVFNSVFGKIIVRLGWRTSLTGEGLLTLVCLLPFTIFVLKLKPEKGTAVQADCKAQKTMEEAADITGCSAKEAYQTPNFYLFVMANVALTVVAGLIQLIPSHVMTRGYAITFGAMVMSGAMIGCAAGNVLIGRLLDCFSTEKSIMLFVTFGIVGMGSMAFFSSKIIFLSAGVLAGLGQSVFQTGIPFCVQKAFGRMEYSRIYAALVIPGSVVGTFSAAFGGVIYDLTGNYFLMMLMLCGMYLISGPCILMGLRIKKTNKSLRRNKDGYGCKRNSI